MSIDIKPLVAESVRERLLVARARSAALLEALNRAEEAARVANDLYKLSVADEMDLIDEVLQR
ncbi:hypothetical protein [Microbacterium terrisoli]|jgi:hypothetical protein|uniref:hypothetical protein n=1 Tax=Microbacterium terrisoli TaxID=3242192 RepID=UPI002803B9DF|nr:hypothetical protein [Microbacterium protaetiae]